jgi:hypothetical protein
MVKNLSTALVFFEEKMVVHAAKYPNVFRRSYGILSRG